MNDCGYVVSCDVGSIPNLEQQLRTLLPADLDVRLFPVSRSAALLRVHLVDALLAANPGRTVEDVLRMAGIAGSPQPVSSLDIQARISHRLQDELDPRPPVARAFAPSGVDRHLAQCGFPEAWALLGGASRINWGTVKVGQVDTGYTEHPAFGFGQASGTWIVQDRCRSFLPPLGSGELPEIEFDRGDGTDPLSGPNGGHGTRIGATICGFDPAAAGGHFSGAAPRVPLIMVRATNNVYIGDRERQVAQAVDYLVREGVDVINISLGSLPPTTLRVFKKALSNAYNAGVIVVCAAGNIVRSVVTPARLNRTLAIAGVTLRDVPWSGSSYGPQVDLSATAADIWRAHVNGSGQFSYAGGGDGTSYATALTTGAAAMWLAFRGADIDARYGRNWRRVAAFRELARNTARKPVDQATGEIKWQSGSFGEGILDVPALLQASLPTTIVEEPEP